MLAIELPEEIDRRLERLALMTGRSKADYVREALIEHLDDLEDIAVAEERLRENLPPISMEEMEKRLGLED